MQITINVSRFHVFLISMTLILSLFTFNAMGTGFSSGQPSHLTLFADTIRGKSGGTVTVSDKLTVGGVIESTSGGIKFPDGTVQTSSTITSVSVRQDYPGALCDGATFLPANCPAGTVLSGCSAHTAAFAKLSGAFPQGNSCFGGCGGGGVTTVAVIASCIKLT